MSDFTYVENVAHAFICAEEALGSHMVSVSGKVLLLHLELSLFCMNLLSYFTISLDNEDRP